MKHYCEDCKVRMFPRNWFMVHNHLWEKYGVGKKMVCMDCFQLRMGRELNGNDLMDCFLNKEVNKKTIELLMNQ
jgi:hypothetical protein